MANKPAMIKCTCQVNDRTILIERGQVFAGKLYAGLIYIGSLVAISLGEVVFIAALVLVTGYIAITYLRTKKKLVQTNHSMQCSKSIAVARTFRVGPV